MSTETMIALSAAVVFGIATAAVAMINYEATASLAELAPQSAPAAVYAHHRVAGYDTDRAEILRGQPTRSYSFSLKHASWIIHPTMQASNTVVVNGADVTFILFSTNSLTGEQRRSS